MTASADHTSPTGLEPGSGPTRAPMATGTTAGNSARPLHGIRGQSAPPPLPWLAWRPGERVVVRYRLTDGLHDALGTLVESTADHVLVETRRGRIRVDAQTMVTGKRVPPPPALWERGDPPSEA